MGVRDWTFLRLGIAAAGLLSACSATPPAVSTPQACRLDREADLPMAAGTSYAVVSARIDGQPVSMLLDTGDERLAIRAQMQAVLRLPEDLHHTTIMHGIGGASTAHDLIIQRFELGGTELPQSGASVMNLPAVPVVDPPLAGVIGGQILSGYDVEFDFAARRVLLWQRSGCDAATPAWQGTYASADLERSTGSLMTVPVAINGQHLRALLDTGALTTTVSVEAASRLGLTAAALAAGRTAVTRGADGRDVFTHVARLHSVAIGAARRTDMPVLVAPVHIPFADLLLGADFFQHHRLWIAYAAQRAFIK